MEISVVIPVYGCKAAIPELYKRLTDTLSRITAEYEIILVDDACPQGSWEEIESLCNEDRRVIGIELSRNFGQMKAILAGLDQARGNWIVVMDCDLQDRPEEITRLYQTAIQGYDVVLARRESRRDPWIKKALASLFYSLYNYATDGNYDGKVSNFSICKKEVIAYYCKMREIHRGYVMYLKWLGFKQITIDVEHNDRYEGKSSYSVRKRLNLAMELLTSQSDKILKGMIKLGMLLTMISIIISFILVYRYFTLDISPGWTSLIVCNILIGGIVISSIGIVGMYVGNIFMQTKNRPLYVIGKQLNGKETTEE